MKIMMDTSVWLECRVDEELKMLVEALATVHEFRTSEMIDEEISDAYNFLRERRMKGADVVSEFYEGSRKATIRLTDFVKRVARAYAEEGKRFNLPAKKMEADFAIVAAASVDGVDFILTLNRKTMAADPAKAAYAVVNSRMKLKTPQFLTDKNSFRGLSYVQK